MRKEPAGQGGRIPRTSWWLLFVTLEFSLGAVADPPLDWDKVDAGYIPSPEQLRDHMALLDSKFDELKTKIAGLDSRFPATTDARGRTMKDDWRDYVLAEPSQADIATQHQRMTDAIEAFRWRDAIAALEQVRFVMGREMLTMKGITDYWQQIADHPPHFEPYWAMLQANSITPHYAKNFESLDRTFQLQLDHGLFAAAMNITMPKMRALRARAARLDSSALESLGDLPDDKRLDPMTASGACVPEASESSGGASAKLDPKRPAAELVYPIDSRRLGEQGRVYVGIVVGATGCVMKASVYGSSGYERLDRAAVKHALGMRYLPAERDGKPIDTVCVIPVNFVLNQGFMRTAMQIKNQASQKATL
jgi:TonB family protein